MGQKMRSSWWDTSLPCHLDNQYDENMMIETHLTSKSCEQNVNVDFLSVEIQYLSGDTIVNPCTLQWSEMMFINDIKGLSQKELFFV